MIYGDLTNDRSGLWRDYVRDHANYKPGLICSGQNYDLTEWPAEARAKYEFKNMDDSDI